jgi:hypothetical protein
MLKARPPSAIIAPAVPDNDAAPLIAQELRAYLESQDNFAFEREIFTHAKSFGLTVQHAGLYEDQLSEKFRQFDLRASKLNGNHRISLAIECKSLTASYPLLVSCVPRAADESYHEVMHSPAAGVQRVQSRLYAADEPVGKTMRQVGRARGGGFAATDEKALFDKYQQAMASSADLIVGAAEEQRPRRATSTFAAILPILVVPDGTLWMARYSSRGRLERDPEQTNEVSFYLGRPYPMPLEPLRPFTISHLHVMTKTAVADLLQQVGEPRANGIWQLMFE